MRVTRNLKVKENDNIMVELFLGFSVAISVWLGASVK